MKFEKTGEFCEKEKNPDNRMQSENPNLIMEESIGSCVIKLAEFGETRNSLTINAIL